MAQTQNSTHKTQKQRGFKTGLIILVAIFQVIIIFMYGFYGAFKQSSNYSTSLQYVFTNMLAFLGFGLLLIQYKTTINHTFILLLIVASVTIQLSPLLQKFWFNVFTNGFFEKNYKQQDLAFALINDTSHNQQIQLNFGYTRISSHCMISLLVGLGGVVGNIRGFNIICLSILFNIGFTLNYYLNFEIYRSQSVSNNGSIMDDFQGSRVFLFGASFGIPLMIAYQYLKPINNNELREREEKIHFSQQFSKSLKVIGAIFFISSFYYMMDSYTTKPKVFGLLNIYFASSGALVSCIGISLIIFCEIKFELMIMSLIAGVMQISIIGAYLKTPFASLVVGTFAGLVTTLLGEFLHKNKINAVKIIDTNGIFVVYFVNTFLCSFFVAPITILICEKYGQSNNVSKSFHMKYSGISLGIGMGFGVLGAIMRKLIKQDTNTESISLKEIENSKEQLKFKDENKKKNEEFKEIKEIEGSKQSLSSIENKKNDNPIEIQFQ